MHKKHTVTIKDIASVLGISVSTVSKALSNHPRISSVTKENVLRVSKELDYEPNQMALNLKKKHSFTVGVMVPDLGHYYFSSVISGIESVLSKNGYNLLICQSNEREESERANIKILSRSQVDGFIICLSKEVEDLSHFQTVLDQGIPMIFFDRVDKRLDAPSITTDDKEGAYNGTKRLIESGCKDIIGLFPASSFSLSKNRLEGFKKALTEANIKFDKSSIYYSDFSFNDAVKIANMVLTGSKIPDGIFVGSDYATLGVLKVLKEKTKSLKKEVKLAGFLNDVYKGFEDKRLTRITQPTFEMGMEAATFFLQMIKGNELGVKNKMLKTLIVE